MSIVNGIVGQNSNWYEFYFDWWENNINTNGNKSDVTVVTYLKRKTSYSFDTVNPNQTQTININGDSASINRRVDLTSIGIGSSIELYRRTITVEHNADGSKTINVSVSAATGGGYGAGNCSANANITLSTIPRASQPSLITFPNTTREFTIGDIITVHCNRKSNFTHIAWLNYGDKKIKIAENVTNNFEFDTSKYLDIFYKYIPNNTSGIGTISLDTYNGNKLIGSKSVEFVANVPSTIVPTIDSIQIEEADEDIKASFDVFVKDNSKLKIRVNASGAEYSTIKSYKIEVNETSYNSKEVVTEVLKNSGENNIKVTVTDSRGRSTSSIKKINVINYFQPYFGDIQVVDRTDSMGFSSEEGTNISIVMDLVYCLLNSNNVIWTQVSYKKKSDLQYIDLDPQIYDVGNIDENESDKQFYFTIENIDIDSSYDVKITIYDMICKYKNIATEKIWEVSTGYTTIDYLTGGKGVAIGKVAEKEGLEIALLTTFINGIDCIKVDSGDANDYKIGGFYDFTENNSNIPMSEENFIIVIGNNERCIQISIIIKTTKIYLRSFYSGIWSEWREK